MDSTDGLEGAGYASVQGGYQQAPQHDMGGGQGAMGSGVAGGHEGSGAANTTQDQAGQAEKQDWLDKGLEAVGKKAGYSMSDKQADSAGDFINKQFKERTGRNLPGVQ